MSLTGSVGLRLFDIIFRSLWLGPGYFDMPPTPVRLKVVSNSTRSDSKLNNGSTYVTQISLRGLNKQLSTLFQYSRNFWMF